MMYTSDSKHQTTHIRLYKWYRVSRKIFGFWSHFEIVSLVFWGDYDHKTKWFDNMNFRICAWIQIYNTITENENGGILVCNQMGWNGTTQYTADLLGNFVYGTTDASKVKIKRKKTRASLPDKHPIVRERSVVITQKISGCQPFELCGDGWMDKPVFSQFDPEWPWRSKSNSTIYNPILDLPMICI